MYQCYYQTDYQDNQTRCKNQQEDCWCSEEHKQLWQQENYKDHRMRGVKQLSPKALQIGMLDIQLRELRKKWVKATDLFEKADIETRGKIIKQKRAILVLDK